MKNSQRKPGDGATAWSAVRRAAVRLAAVVALVPLCLVLSTIAGGPGQALAHEPGPGGATGPGRIADGAIVERIQKRGYVVCGSNANNHGFSRLNADGHWQGLDTDFCRVLATALLGDPARVAFVPLSSRGRFDALLSGEVDVLLRTTTWTLSRDAGLPLDFAGVIYHDGQAFMARTSHGWSRLSDVTKATVCVETGTTSELNLADYAARTGVEMKPMLFHSLEESKRAFFTSRCDLYTNDSSALTSIRGTDAPDPSQFVIFPERISKEPLGPAVVNTDRRWYDIVRWAVFATVAAEELGVSQATLDRMLASRTPAVRRLLGVDPGIGAPLGLDDRWVRRVIRDVGNYADIYDRNVGPGTIHGLQRGLNALWTDGGLLYAPPFR